MASVTICSDFGAQENKVCHCFHCFPSICHEVMGPDAMILVFWMLSFKPTFSLSSFTFIKRLFSSSSLSAMRVVSSAYLRLLIFLLGIMIPACASSSSTFNVVYSTPKLHIRVTICSREVLLYLFGTIPLSHVGVLTVASSPACRFLTRHSHLFKNFPVSCNLKTP